MVLLKPLYFLLVGISALSIIILLVFSHYYANSENPNSVNSIITNNFFSDNVTRSAIMQIDKKQNDARLGLSVNVLTQLTVVGKTNTIQLYPLSTAWHNAEPFNVTFETENQKSINNSLGYNTGRFLDIFAIPDCTTMDGKVEPIRSYLIPTIENHNYNKVFARYTLSDILPENEQYHVKFVSLYYVKINLPEGSTVIGNHTTTCTIISNQNKNSAFVNDITFKLG